MVGLAHLHSPSGSFTPDFKRGTFILLLRLTWSYRSGCINIQSAQVVLLTMDILGLFFTGLAIDVIRHHLDPSTPSPAWPGGWGPSETAATLTKSVEGMMVTQSFVRQQLNASLFRNLVENHSRYNVDVARTSAVFIPLFELNNQLFNALLLLMSGAGAV